MKEEQILQILKKELTVALGCTEPAAIALAAATAKKQLTGELTKMEVKASGNIIKNAKAVGIPGMNERGIEFVAALGAIAGQADKELEVLEGITKEEEERAIQFVKDGKVKLSLADQDKKLFIEIRAFSKDEEVRVVIADRHSDIVLIEKDGKSLFQGGCENVQMKASEQELKKLTIDTIVDFIKHVDMSKLELVKKSIELNKKIGVEGLQNEYGLQVGKTIKDNIAKGWLSDDLATRAMSLSAAGSDARMAGSTMPVMANTGSGNQGIAVTLPVVAVGEKLQVNEEKLIRAVALSHLITIHIKSKFGRLSALCGVTVAGMGASAAITYLLGGDLQKIKGAIQNTIGNVSGMVCDGAKAGCAMKVATCSSVAVQSAILSMNNQSIQSTDGFIADDVEKTIDNFCTLGNEGTKQTDEVLLKLMVNK
ncbi:L-serine ammonia-lyase, iron-sulfur-dependent, subunit alpha [Bacillus sp. FJAT-47783]|uniref:L-cysteine desulfidase family protein n=1 Tax=Bacillus sp. FJAT-47783 TaxID=2922712 RepID=UPI001FAC0A65